jgi:hypothetical protein
VLGPQHREALAALKLELLALLRKTGRKTEFETSKRRLESAGISIAVWEDGSFRVLVSEADTLQAIGEGSTIYSPADMFFYVQLEPGERKLLHAFKRRFGGSTEWRREAGAL